MRPRQNTLAARACCLAAIVSVLFVIQYSTLANGAYRSWARQSSGTLAWLHAIFFVNEQKGWAAGSRGTLLGTTDGGKTWQPRRLPTIDGVRDIFFTDESNGWLVCEPNIYELQNNKDP